MAEEIIYTYTLNGRRPAMMLAAIVATAMLVFGVSYAAPLSFLAVIGLTLAMALLGIVANPRTGMQLTRTILHFYNRSDRRNVSVDAIASVTIQRHMDGGESALLYLRSGEKVPIPSLCMDSKLSAAFKKLGIEVQES